MGIHNLKNYTIYNQVGEKVTYQEKLADFSERRMLCEKQQAQKVVSNPGFESTAQMVNVTPENLFAGM